MAPDRCVGAAEDFRSLLHDKARGTGLGLAICYSIVQSHGGHIEAASAAGKGATFTVWLPASRGQPGRYCDMAEQRNAAAEGRVLVMDDEQIVRTMLAGLLVRAGMNR